MHEYGHGIDAVKGGIVNGGYSEGFGDAGVVLATREPCVGRDFFGAGACLRSASDVILWPSPGQIHTVGRPYRWLHLGARSAAQADLLGGWSVCPWQGADFVLGATTARIPSDVATPSA